MHRPRATELLLWFPTLPPKVVLDSLTSLRRHKRTESLLKQTTASWSACHQRFVSADLGARVLSLLDWESAAVSRLKTLVIQGISGTTLIIQRMPGTYLLDFIVDYEMETHIQKTALAKDVWDFLGFLKNFQDCCAWYLRRPMAASRNCRQGGRV